MTIPKHIRVAADVASSSEVAPILDGSKIINMPVATLVTDDRRSKLKMAAARVRNSFSVEFRRLNADEIMNFIRSDKAVKGSKCRGTR